MKRMPILIACAATMAALGGAGIAMNKPTTSQSPASAPGAIANLAQASAATPQPAVQAPDSQGQFVGSEAASARETSAAPRPEGQRQAAPSPTPLASANSNAAPAAVGPNAGSTLPPVIRRLALKAQTETVKPYRPQAVTIRDEVPPGSSFDRFRTRLRQAVRDRDADFLRQIAREDISLSFGRDITLEQRLSEPNDALWNELERAIGGDCATDGSGYGSEQSHDYFACPASFVTETNHPDIDPYMTVYVNGTDVAVRQLPSTNSPVLLRVSNSILQSTTLPWDEALTQQEDQQLNAWYQASETTSGWKFVSLPDGRKGFISSRYAYSALGYRAVFQPDDAGDWTMTAFIAGD